MQIAQLKPETTTKIHELAQVNLDSSEGFRKAAEVVANPILASLFREYADERAAFSVELSSAIPARTTDKELTGTLMARVHRWWMEVRALFTGGGDHAVLSVVESAEDQIKAAYEEVILDTVGSPLSDVLHAQLRKVKAGHDRIRSMRDAAKS